MQWNWGKRAAVAAALLATVVTSAPAPAAKKKPAAASGGVAGQVVGSSHAKAVSGARVQVAKPKSAHPARRRAKAAKKTRHRHAHPAGVMSKAGGHFAMSRLRPGTHTLVAHKKHVGSGRARVTVSSNATAQVVIRLHQHHHHHSGVATLAVRSHHAHIVVPTAKPAASGRTAPVAVPMRKK